MPKAGEDGERPGTWSTFQENWPAILGATALGLSVALLGRWCLSDQDSPNSDETAVERIQSAPAIEQAALATGDSPPAAPFEPPADPAEPLADAASGWQFAPVAAETQQPLRIVSVDPQEDAAPAGAWLTGRIEEIVDEPPLANAARLLDDLPVRR